MKTAIELADEFPEQNLANIEPDAVNHLNWWGLEAMAMLLQQVDQIEALSKQVFGLTGEVANKADYAKSMYAMHQEAQAENETLKADAERYRWMRTNSKSWSWTPSQYNIDIVSGFAAGGTGYLGYSFEDAINIAMKGKS